MSVTQRAGQASQKPRGGYNRLGLLIAVFLLVSLVLALLSFFDVQRWTKNNERYLYRANELRILVEDIGDYGEMAISGSKGGFDKLSSARDKFQSGIDLLKEGSDAEGLPPAPAEVSGALIATESAWSALRESVDTILGNEASLVAIHDLVDTTKKTVVELKERSDGLVKAVVAAHGTAPQVLAASVQLVTLERIAGKLDEIQGNPRGTPAAVDAIKSEMDRFGAALESLQNGGDESALDRVKDPAVKDRVKAVKDSFESARSAVPKMANLVPGVLTALSSAENLRGNKGELTKKLDDLRRVYRGNPGRVQIGGIAIGPAAVFVFGGLALLFLVLLTGHLLAEARRREEESKRINDTNQQAIIRLLDEMGDLADGDLTVQATVTENITGAIADSVNYAIDALRSLVSTINEASYRVTDSAQGTRSTAIQLAEASEVQARHISETTVAIESMARAIDEMSQNASESAEVASRSVEVAGKGGQAVRSTIHGMDMIREQIQETSKRIKRLGESSQEIGEIVELIDDIADQTNILALNASMQAAMAGPAGRGFAVVADEVQRLAERSSNATKQIDALVKTIQADTNEAVSSMKASTSEVVNGAKLAEDAGDALMEIENVSNYISDLTRKIADSARKEAESARKIDVAMVTIRDISVQTSEGTRKTAASVEMLADLAVDLQRSIAGFRLPR